MKTSKKNRKPWLLTKYFLKFKWHYFIGFLAVVIVDYIQLQIPLLTGQISDGLQGGNYNSSILFGKIVWIVLIGLSIAIFRYIWRYYLFGTSRKIEGELRNDFFNHLEKLSLKFYNENKIGDLMAYATNDIGAIRMMVGPGVLMGLDVVLLTSLVLYQMITKISIELTFAAIIPLPIIAIGSLVFGKHMRARFKEKQEAFAFMSDIVQESISGIRVIKAFVQEGKEMIAFNRINKNNYDKNIRVVKLHAIMFPLAMMISGLSIAVVLGYGGYLAILGKISLGELVAFIQYLLILVWPMIAFGWCLNIMSQGSASLSRLEELLAIAPEVFDDKTVKSIEKIKGKIEFRNLTFQYPGAKTEELKNISLTVNEGETLGIIGRTGSGKTTMINLLLRLHNPPRDSIFIDGIDVMEIPLKVLRGAFGYVPQDNFLFSDTIGRNVAFSSEQLSQLEIEEAAKHANVHKDIIEFVNGYETIVGERGVTLSGGQKQRLSIARALIKKPPILILDDAVSAVDTNTEEEIMSHLKLDRENKTTIIIAHRISTLQNANHIIVVDEGRIIEQGTHEELVELNGLYYDMVQKQRLEKELLDQE
ncbi:MAG: ABC transporter ATP-binding protein [Firmicutes bacterium HGW-Firmicutes-1]|jgi:ATP-binding cassette subfamily B protein|nr:MAG: ABC transporter ATP-binding protein [Firmicutes bacterium HGW-Firmicutes-1]